MSKDRTSNGITGKPRFTSVCSCCVGNHRSRSGTGVKGIWIPSQCLAIDFCYVRYNYQEGSTFVRFRNHRISIAPTRWSWAPRKGTKPIYKFVSKFSSFIPAVPAVG